MCHGTRVDASLHARDWVMGKIHVVQCNVSVQRECATCVCAVQHTGATCMSRSATWVCNMRVVQCNMSVQHVCCVLQHQCATYVLWHNRNEAVPGAEWRRRIGSPKLQIIFHKRATNCRSLLRKMTYKKKGSYESSPPCNCDASNSSNDKVLHGYFRRLLKIIGLFCKRAL